MRPWRCLGLMLVAAAVAGCSRGPRTYPVSGRVVFADGQPVDSGTIEFRNAELALNARGKIAKDGAFSLTTFHPGDGAVEGEHQVIIVQHLMVETPRPVQHGGDGHAHAPHRAVDRRFARYGESPLRANVLAEGKNELELIVEEAGKESRNK